MPKTDEMLTGHARALRREQTPAEKMLWSRLRSCQLGIRIARQVSVGSYILDFAARSARLAIEIDGDTHVGRGEYDARRTAFLARQGYRVIRFTNGEVMGNADGVVTAIAAALAAPSTPHPDPLPGGEREVS